MTLTISKPILYAGIAIILAMGLMAGFYLSNHVYKANAQAASCTVDNNLLTRLYDAIFHRPLDAGASFHLGKDLPTVLDDLSKSQEHRMYTGLFTAAKALEERRREPGDVPATDEEQIKNLIDSALSNVTHWADTLPEQARANAVIGPDQARNAIQTAYDSMNPTAQAAAEFGLFQAQERLGKPADIPVPTQ